MAMKITQFRYYPSSDKQNYPIDLSRGSLVDGTAFERAKPIVQLGIQPGKP